jgi:hypothetical protein
MKKYSSMDDARFNVFWFLSLIAPAVMMLIASFGRRLWQCLIVGGLSLCIAYWFCLLAVDRKWDVRLAQATIEAQRQWVYDSDGGNEAFTAVVTGPIEAGLYTVIWGLIGWKLGLLYRHRSANQAHDR